MNVVVEQGIITGSVIAPPSKSVTQRAYAAALLHSGLSTIHNPGTSADEQAALGIIQQLGAKIIANREGIITIESNGVNPIGNDTINCGESGLAARLFTPIAATSRNMLTVTGAGSLLKRPMEGFTEALPALGVRIGDFNEYLPLMLQGPLTPKSIKVNGSGGSQFISGLLFALAHSATEEITLSVTGLKSKPYIDLTLDMLALCGRPVKNIFYREFIIDPQKFSPPAELNLHVEADWSSAAYFLVAGAIAGNVRVNHLALHSQQADKAILQLLMQVEALLSITDNSITAKTNRLRAFDFDATHSPDLFPILAILASCCDGESSIKGVHRLFYKESNRVESITQMLHDFAVPFSVEDDMLFVTGVSHLQGTVIDSYNDHRIVMAAAVGALRARGPVDISAPDAVNKSYPGFFDDLQSCGAKCTFSE